MKQLFTLFLFSVLVTASYAQEVVSIRGTVENASDDSILENVNIVNLNQVWGATTDKKGAFEIRAVVNDTLFFSYLGFKSIRVRVTNDWLSYGIVKIKMTEIGIALEEVIVKPVTLTGYIEVDARTIPIYDNYRYRIEGIGGSGYEGGDKQPSALNKVLSSVFNPADFLYNVFGKRPRQMKKLRKMKENDAIRNLLASKFDRETLMAVLQLERLDIDEILNNCTYSSDFITAASDLQILDAISECYEEYRVLNRGK
ncbi:MAG TPA: hypothetical protein DCL52_05420 [Flavobacteriaceae bacterium]|jgi:hypothetical protein|nr:carboxypeptidase-like regulatory domain-containing protein [Ulvibacter sp.]CAI8387251.1 MAG: Uncharacterised protein [Flavobacteriaceae bacterium]HAH34209.1 hypothetical protein [Flavobacteriaceae bacterium]|tara:strand:- start:15332 stop:16099 length:768 start_codon:yes stop_codon:yes gene_type:complete